MPSARAPPAVAPDLFGTIFGPIGLHSFGASFVPFVADRGWPERKRDQHWFEVGSSE